LDGGNDGLNTIVPYQDPAYAQHRRRLRLPEAELLKVTDQWAMHPSMRGLSELFAQQRLAVVHGVGYPNPNRSHFESMKIWQAASTDREAYELDYGWLGNSLGSHRAGDSTIDCFHVGAETVPVALRGRRCHCVSLSSSEDLNLPSPPPNNAQPAAVASNSLSEYVLRDVSRAYMTATNIRNHTQEDMSARYPNTKLAENLKLVSQLIKSDAGARVYYTLQSGYDTHASQLSTHADLLAELSGGVKSFMDDMRASGLEERVLLMCFSEFGRRAAENDSLGTDHGAAGPMLLAGSRLSANSFGRLPSLTDLDEGDLRFNQDFRAVYAAIVQDWLKLTKPASIAGFVVPTLFS
jgi:uncharacterized protein (DUF1501 family)